MRKIILLLAFASFFGVYAQKTTETISSSKLNEDREITIGLPASYEKNTSKEYPLVLVLDGEYLFDAFQGTINYATYWDDMPEVILVGINQNKNNERDTDCSVEESTGALDEKGQVFYDFIKAELMPYLEKKFRLSPLKIIAGHDVTAGFINFFLAAEKPLFNSYIVFSPELAKDMEEQIAKELSALKQPVFYYLSTADGDLKKMKNRITKLNTDIMAIEKPIVNYKFDDFVGASHYSLVLNSIPNALYQIFKIYQPISVIEYNEKIVILKSGHVDYLTDKYDLMEKTIYINMPIRYNDFKAIEAAILKRKAYDELAKLAELANKKYPKSMLGSYYLAEMYDYTEDYKKAIKSYQSAYQKEEIGDLTKTMMLDKMDELKSQ